MSIQQTTTCDVCGSVRGPGNKWLSYAPATDKRGPYAMDFREKSKHHICSEACVHKAQSLWLEDARKRQQ